MKKIKCDECGATKVLTAFKGRIYEDAEVEKWIYLPGTKRTLCHYCAEKYDRSIGICKAVAC